MNDVHERIIKCVDEEMYFLTQNTLEESENYNSTPGTVLEHFLVYPYLSSMSLL